MKYLILAAALSASGTAPLHQGGSVTITMSLVDEAGASVEAVDAVYGDVVEVNAAVVVQADEGEWCGHGDRVLPWWISGWPPPEPRVLVGNDRLERYYGGWGEDADDPCGYRTSLRIPEGGKSATLTLRDAGSVKGARVAVGFVWNQLPWDSIDCRGGYAPEGCYPLAGFAVHPSSTPIIIEATGSLPPGSPDANADGRVDASDALILYYAFSLRAELGAGR